ncbi:MAG: 30S ribosomal protein S20 [Clostridia bacterium]|nr:30S ribosomal protein S20 [Clostridia bacterium]MBQ3495588.1 30S ribosomal protein S20 [Clostridia bacterium]MBQ4586868.1 30S ribosomal protein S20 [Clostridia bacterium]MBQ6883377.1 30S ribosomal protein S20 [Clostridia bacterium]MBR2933145.1 30S ribosomal protein S20 [Clostridia bacterium]
MPNIKSAKKRVLITEVKNAQNRSAMAEVKTSIRKLNAAIESGDKVKAQELLRETSKLLDQAVSAGRMHLNTAANKKSGFAKRVNKLA